MFLFNLLFIVGKKIGMIKTKLEWWVARVGKKDIEIGMIQFANDILFLCVLYIKYNNFKDVLKY